MNGFVSVEGQRIYVRAPWDPKLTAALRVIPGRRPESEPGTWSVPLTVAPLIMPVALAHGLDIDPEVHSLAASGTVAPAVGWHGKMFELRFDPLDQALAAAAAAIPGALWFGPRDCWVVPRQHGTAVLNWAKAAGAEVDDAADAHILDAMLADERILQSMAKHTDWQPTKPIGMELFDYQRAGVEYILGAHGQAIVGDEPGVGKTLQAIAAANELDAFPLIVVCPASLKVNWRREVRRALPERSVEIVRGSQPVPRLLWADVAIINYDILPNWVDNLPEPRGVVCDESHRIKNPHIERTKSAIALMDRVPDGGLRLCLSGTPVPNDPSEIATQLTAIGRVGEFGGIHAARKRLRARPAELNRQMRATCYIRRLKKDVWVDMPERRWAELYVEGEPNAMAEYRRAEADIVAYIGELAAQAARDSGETEDAARRAAWTAALRASAAEQLVALGRLRQLAAQAAMPALLDWSRNHVSTGEKLGVFGLHTAIVDEFAESLNAVKVQGGMTEAARQQSVDLFQTRPEVKVFAGQVHAAGEGLTLTAASTCLLAEIPWNQAAMDQVLDRFHRRGQENDVVGFIALIEGTIGEDILELVREKQKDVDAVIDGVRRKDGTSVVGDLLVRLAERSGRV